MPDLQAGLPSGTSVWCQPGERFNTWSHLAALLVGVVASVGLICETVAGGDARKIAGSVVFGLSLAALFGASALFHGCTGARKRFWQRVDHACIYLLIAGSHTPFALMAPSGLWAWSLLAGVWALALQGAIRALGFDSPPRLSLYISLGWLSLGGRGAGGLWPWCADPGLAARRRTALFGRNGVLPSSGEHAPRARHLASVRGCRQRLPYRRGSRFARLTACHSWLRHPAGRFLAHSIAERSRGCQHQRVNKHFV